MPPKKEEKKETIPEKTLPKIKSNVPVKDSNAQKAQEVAKKDLSKSNPSANLMKKAIDATSKNDQKQANRAKGSSSYVKTDKDGKKVINLHKSNQPEVDEQDREDQQSQNKPKAGESKYKMTGNSSVFERLNKQGIHHNSFAVKLFNYEFTT
jgi:hypothetical protein